MSCLHSKISYKFCETIMKYTSRFAVSRCFFLLLFWFTVCSPVLATGEHASRAQSLHGCTDNIPHPGTIRLYVNEKLRIIPYTDYPMPFLGYESFFDEVKCQKYIPVVEVHEYYRDSKNNYVEKENAYFITIHLYDIEGKTSYADGINEQNK